MNKKKKLREKIEGEVEKVAGSSIYEKQGVMMVDATDRIWKPLEVDEWGKIILPQTKISD